MNSPLSSTPSIASRIRGRNGAYCAFTSTSGIGRTIGKSRRPSPTEDQIRREGDNHDQDRVVHEAEVAMEMLVAGAGAVAGAREGEGPDRRADESQDDVAPERHPEDPRGNRDERADDRRHAPEQHRPGVPAIEPAFSPIELLRAEMEPAPVVLQERPPAVEADRPAGDRAEEVAERACERRGDKGPGVRGDPRPEQIDVLAGEGAGREGTRVDHDELTERGQHCVDRHQTEDGVDAVVSDQRGERAGETGDRHREEATDAGGTWRSARPPRHRSWPWR